MPAPRKERRVTRQEIHWIPEGRSIPMGEKPFRVWTLFDQDRDKKPTLPFQPIHNQNAFLEDFGHDWTLRNGALRYFSRVAHHDVWILCEFSEGA